MTSTNTRAESSILEKKKGKAWLEGAIGLNQSRRISRKKKKRQSNLHKKISGKATANCIRESKQHRKHDITTMQNQAASKKPIVFRAQS